MPEDCQTSAMFEFCLIFPTVLSFMKGLSFSPHNPSLLLFTIFFMNVEKCAKEILALFFTILINFQQSELLSWTLEDSDLLLEKVAESGKEKVEEVDFEGIFDGQFQGICANWQHLQKRLKDILSRSRHYYNIPCFKKEGLQAAVKEERERRQVGNFFKSSDFEINKEYYYWS